MAETAPTAEIARRVCDEIFSNFFWEIHPKSDDNFACSSSTHRTPKDKQKLTHPADVVFYYDDPYRQRKIYLHTDMKSYGEDSINTTAMRNALRSMCMTIECARSSEDWRRLYSVADDEQYDIQGFLFVHNHDKGCEEKFDESIERIDLSKLPIAVNTVIHFMGPVDISRLYSIANDLIRLKYQRQLPEEEYTFYYPDLLLHRRNGDYWKQAATVELLMSPFMIIKHGATDNVKPGYLIYYNRPGSTVDEFIYFLDCISRFQMLEHGQVLRVRSCAKSPDKYMLSNFEAAKKQYSKAWSFDSARTSLLSSVKLETITVVTDSYNPGTLGWRDDEN